MNYCLSSFSEWFGRFHGSPDFDLLVSFLGFFFGPVEYQISCDPTLFSAFLYGLESSR